MLLKSSSDVTLEVPKSIKLSSITSQVKEMEKFEVAVYLESADGKGIKTVGGPGNPWISKLSKLAGDGKLVGTVEAKFTDGMAVFDDVALDSKGSGYKLKVDVTPPDSTPMPSLILDSFDVEDRPLDLKSEEENVVVPQNTPFAFITNIWDAAKGSKAEKATLASLEWECSVSLIKGKNNATLSGTLEITVSPGEPVVKFDDLVIDTTGLDYKISAECTSTDYAYSNIVLESSPFHVYPVPEVKTEEEAVVKFNFEGPLVNIWNLTKTLNPMLQGLQCEPDCPDIKTNTVKVPTSGWMKIRCPWD